MNHYINLLFCGFILWIFLGAFGALIMIVVKFNKQFAFFIPPMMLLIAIWFLLLLDAWNRLS